MKKPYEYYIDKINKTYPELKKLFGNYERIAANINAELAAGGTGKIAVKELYNYTLVQFERLAKYYADNELDHKTFEDAMSALYVELMDLFNKKLDTGKWFKNLNIFHASLARAMEKFFAELNKNISNKIYLINSNHDGMDPNLISKTRKRDTDTELTRVQIDTEKDMDWLETLEDVVATAQPDEMLACKLLKELFQDVLSQLTPSEQRVIEEIFGIKDNTPKNLRTVAKKFGVNTERIRQILVKALNKLRRPRMNQKLRDFVDRRV